MIRVESKIKGTWRVLMMMTVRMPLDVRCRSVGKGRGHQPGIGTGTRTKDEEEEMGIYLGKAREGSAERSHGGYVYGEGGVMEEDEKEKKRKERKKEKRDR